jgi:hypothetical protein
MNSAAITAATWHLKCHMLKLNKYYGTDINDNEIKYLQTVKGSYFVLIFIQNTCVNL